MSVSKTRGKLHDDGGGVQAPSSGVRTGRVLFSSSHSLSPTETNRNCSRFGAVYYSKFFCKKKYTRKKNNSFAIDNESNERGKRCGRRRVRANLKKRRIYNDRARSIVSIFASFSYISRFNTSTCNAINGSDFFFEKGGGDKLPHSGRV